MCDSDDNLLTLFGAAVVESAFPLLLDLGRLLTNLVYQCLGSLELLVELLDHLREVFQDSRRQFFLWNLLLESLREPSHEIEGIDELVDPLDECLGLVDVLEDLAV